MMTQKWYARIEADLRKQIVSGKWRPGGRMPTEKDLARLYGVHVLTVRQAEQLLVQRGLIRKEQGRGTFVNERARQQRRVILVCGLAHKPDGTVAEMASTYYHHSIRFCLQAAAARGLAMETVWIPSHPTIPDDDVPVSGGDPVSGYIFLGCDDENPLVRLARRNGDHHVILGKPYEAERTVCFNLSQAAALAWETLREAVEDRGFGLGVVSLEGEQPAVMALAQKIPDGVRLFHLPNTLSAWDVEDASYRAIRRVCADGAEPLAFVFLDEVLARGGTRALLEAGLGGGRCPVVVVCGRQEMAPYGLPVTYITHDTEAEAKWAVEMLAAQIEGRDGGTDPRTSPFVLQAEEECLHEEGRVEELGEVVRARSTCRVSTGIDGYRQQSI